MDDKWNGFVDGNRLYLHRSWTGHRMYEAEFELDGAIRRISEALVRDDDRYDPMSPHTESLQLEIIIEAVFLNEWNSDKIDRLLGAARLEGRLPRNSP
jgi:hypothetical protein